MRTIALLVLALASCAAPAPAHVWGTPSDPCWADPEAARRSGWVFGPDGRYWEPGWGWRPAASCCGK